MEVAELFRASCMVLALVAQVPQILRIVKGWSVAGLSFNAYLFDLCSLTIKILYNYRQGYDFLSYSPSVIYVIQGYAIVFLLLWLDRSNRTLTKLGLVGAVAGCLFLLNSKSPSIDTLTTLMKCALLFSLANKASHIHSITRCKEKPAVDSAQWIIYTYISMVGLYTAVWEQRDILLLLLIFLVAILEVEHQEQDGDVAEEVEKTLHHDGLIVQDPSSNKHTTWGRIQGLGCKMIIVYRLTIKILYNYRQGYDFLSYSPSVIYVIQGYAIVFLLLWLDRSNRTLTKLGLVGAVAGCLFLLNSKSPSIDTLTTLMKCALLFSLANKASHIHSITRCKEKPAVDSAQWIIYTYISMVGLYTAVWEQRDSVLASQHLLTSSLNILIFTLLQRKRATLSENGDKTK
eukprot:sb/3465332/